MGFFDLIPVDQISSGSGSGPLYYYSQPIIYGGFKSIYPVDESGAAPSVRESDISPAEGVLPLLYGRKKVAGQFVYLNIISGVIHAVYVFCEGEIDSFESVLIDDKGSATYGSGVVYYPYTGTMAQTVCGLNTYDATWTDALAGTAYIYFRFTGLDGLPTVSAIIKGKKVYDPRTTLTAYATNPALHLADIFTSKRYGLSYATTDMDWTSIGTAATYCDALIGTPAVKRFEFNYCFSGSSGADIINLIKSHFLGVVLVSDGEKIKFDVGKARGTSATFTEAEIFDVTIPETPDSELINLVRYSWTDPLTWETISNTLEDPNIATYSYEIYEGSYDLSGCLTFSQAKRLAIFLLNSRLLDLKLNFKTFNGRGLEPLDVISVTHSIGLTNKLVYITNIEVDDHGVWSISAREYDPAVFSDVVETNPTYPDTTLPDPLSVPTNVTSLVLSEVLSQLLDSTWISQIRATWVGTWDWLKYYEVWVSKDGGAYFLMATTEAESFEFGPVVESSSYSVKIIAVSLWMVKSTGTIQSYVAQGKLLIPTWKGSAALTGEEAGDQVYLRWAMSDNSQPAVDLDIVGYEIRRGAQTATWDNASFITFVSALTYVDKNCPSGTWRYFLKAKDSVGNYTVSYLFVDVIVTLNPFLGFQQERNFDLLAGALTTAHALRYVTDSTNPIDWAFPSNERIWTAQFNTALAWNSGSQTYPIATYQWWVTPVPGTAQVITPEIDLGAVISGRMSLNYLWDKVGTGVASITGYIMISNISGSGYVTYSMGTNTAPVSQDLSGRYVKARFDFADGNNLTFDILKERAYLFIQANPVVEYGQVSVTATGLYSVVLSNTYLSIVKITLTPFGSGGRAAVVDNLTLVGFDIRLFDLNNVAAAGTVKYEVQGY